MGWKHRKSVCVFVAKEKVREYDTGRSSASGCDGKRDVGRTKGEREASDGLKTGKENRVVMVG